MITARKIVNFCGFLSFFLSFFKILESLVLVILIEVLINALIFHLPLKVFSHLELSYTSSFRSSEFSLFWLVCVLLSRPWSSKCLRAVKVAQLCPILCKPIDCSLTGSSVHRIPQARILEWVDIHFSRGSSQARNWAQVSCIASKFFTV